LTQASLVSLAVLVLLGVSGEPSAGQSAPQTGGPLTGEHGARADVGRPELEDDHSDTAAAQSGAAVAGHSHELSAGGDVRVVMDFGAWSAPSAPRGLRGVGSGVPGHWFSVARGALPATLTAVSLRGRSAEDWVDGGLDLLSASSPAAGALLVPAGHDLSRWPVRTAEWPVWREWPRLSVDMRPIRRPGQVPFSRVVASTGSYGRSTFGAEFGRRFEGGGAVLGAFENEQEGSRFREGDSAVERACGSALAFLDGGWTLEVGGSRTATDRTTPVAGGSTATMRREHIRSDHFVRGASDAFHVELFHTDSWLGSSGKAVKTVRDGVFVSAEGAGPVGRASLEVSRLAASGGLLAENDEAVQARLEAARRFELAGRPLEIAAGAELLDGRTVPLLAARLVDESGGRAWSVDASLSGRHPTALERLAGSWTAPGVDVALSGNRELDPERAVALSASWRTGDPMRVGASGQVVRVLDAIVLEETYSSAATPTNADAEDGAAFWIWADVGDTAGIRCAVDAAVTLVEEDGALNANAPVPVTSSAARVSVPLSLFEDYVRGRLGAELTHEYGLARGPWLGLLDDSRLSLSLAATAGVGSARLYVRFDNVLSTDTERVPGLDPGDVSLSAGFSWRFLD